SAIIVPTEFVASDLANLQPFTKNKITVTLEASEPPLEATAQPLEGAIKPYIMYIGSAFPHKNLFRLVDSFEILLKQQPNLQLVIAGKREHYKQELERYISGKDYAHHIFTPGFVSDEELKWLYENCQAYVFPSESEGFGLPG